ncbi:MAG: hypothetical protein AAB597_01280, partial [Patescibacteria group bacterium]
MNYLEKSVVIRAISSAPHKKGAEYAYALAVLARQNGNMAESYDFAELCISLLNKTPRKTLDDCATSESSLGGIALPS